MRRRLALLISPVVLLGAGCAPEEEAQPEDAASESPSTTSESPGATTAEECAAGVTLQQDDVLTVGTDSPAFEPWFTDNDPSNGEGFESAVAYAVADRLGFDEEEVRWVKVRFNNSYQPGPKRFDFDINQISITAERDEVVDFSDGYYSAAQGVIALEGSPVAEAASVEELAGYKLGAQTGTTSLTAIRDVIRPAEDPLVFTDTNAAKQALQNGQVDAILADVPTAFYITAVEIPGSRLVGQFQPETGEQEEFGMLFEQGSELVPCVNAALAELREDGTLADIEQQWLSDVVDVPVLEPDTE
jgi:polar amino acid transport system substrate-binding protein